ncbi:MAG: hypothetical protein M3Z57_05285 [Candidatus Dormibacteraeota bacterium]|nr:hypothetical protein [Candidatus Dormibacteraeota bacterium]
MRSLIRSGGLVLAGALLATSTGAWPTTTAAAAALTPTCPTLNGSMATTSSTVSPTGGHSFILCSYSGANRVRSFEGTPLRVDLSLPTVPYVPPGATTSAKPPLIIFQSGYSNDYCQFESTTLEGSSVPGCSDFIGTPGYDWNNAWFASNGYAALTFTPRGWYESCGKKLDGSYSYLSDPACQATTQYPDEKSWVHLLDRRYEVHDAQFLAGAVADAGAGTLINPNQIVATGDSGGGGPSWDLGMTQDRVVLPTSTAVPAQVNTVAWTSPLGTNLHLAAALPMYTWTDLADSLLPNGSATDGFNGAPAPSTFHHDTPIGVEKATYVGGLFARGLSNVPSQPPDGAQYAAPGADPTADLNKWFTEINAGEPTFSANPDTPTILAEVGGPLRSSFAMPVPSDNGLAPSLNTQKPIFVMQGLTDPLFPGLQALTMINRLQAAHSHYPVWGFFGDIGHSYAQNPLDVWQQAHAQSNAFLLAALQATSIGQVSQLFTQPTITVDTTRCLPRQTLQSYSANSFGSIATTELTFTDSAAAQTTFNPSGGGPESVMSDPIVTGGKCVTMPSSTADASEATYTFPVSSPATLVGGPVVNLNAAVIGSSAELAARLWDVDASGNQTLITRSVVRIDQAPGSQTIPLSFQLWPNAWQLCSGDSLKLELTQTDAPTFRPDNLPSAMSFSSVKLTLPAVPEAACSSAVVLAESPLLPILPLGAAAVAGTAVLRRRRSGGGLSSRS